MIFLNNYTVPSWLTNYFLINITSPLFSRFVGHLFQIFGNKPEYYHSDSKVELRFHMFGCWRRHSEFPLGMEVWGHWGLRFLETEGPFSFLGVPTLLRLLCGCVGVC